jgi:exosortase
LQPASLTPKQQFTSQISRLSVENLIGWARTSVPAIVAAVAFAMLFAQPFQTLIYDWWNKAEAGHGLLLGPVAIWFAWRSGKAPGARGQAWLGLAILAASVLLRYVSGLAAELFTMRASLVGGLAGLTVYYFGFRQILHWWLPFLLICLSIPLPELVTQQLALPLQMKASKIGAALLEVRHVPVQLSGNVIRIPGHELFVTEACSGLRSLTALLSMSVLMGAVSLRSPVSRVALLLAAIPIAVAINGVRVFLTGFLVYFVSPELGKGFMHSTEGWLLFIVSLVFLGGFTWLASYVENRFIRRAA